MRDVNAVPEAAFIHLDARDITIGSGMYRLAFLAQCFYIYTAMEVAGPALPEIACKKYRYIQRVAEIMLRITAWLFLPQQQCRTYEKKHSKKLLHALKITTEYNNKEWEKVDKKAYNN